MSCAELYIMKDNNLYSRRLFVKGGVAVAGLSISQGAFAFNDIYPTEKFVILESIKLNNILEEYLQVDKIYGYGLKKSTIKNEEYWENKKINILRRSSLMMGEAPLVKEQNLNPQILSETQRDGYTEKKIQFLSDTGDLITGYLLVPVEDRGSPYPAIIALHSTGPGAKQAVGLIPKKNRSYGMELAQRGYVVLAIDVISAGERVFPGCQPYDTCSFYKKYPYWSAMGKMVVDHQKGLDFLCSLDFVDSDRLGCIGHSLGGYNAYFLQAFDKRIKVGVSSCGVSPMGGTNSPYIFARDKWFVHFNPICREYISAGMIPCDMHEIMALVSPRPFFNYSAKMDSIYCSEGERQNGDFSIWWNTVDAALNQVDAVYDLYGKAHNFVRTEKEGGHDFPPDIREQAYRWLDKWLNI